MELRRPPARGLPAARRADRLRQRPGAARGSPARRCARGSPTRSSLHNYAVERAARRAAHDATADGQRRLGEHDDRGRRERDVHRRTCGSPRRLLWSPASPHLYDGDARRERRPGRRGHGARTARALLPRERDPRGHRHRRPPVSQLPAARRPRRRPRRGLADRRLGAQPGPAASADHACQVARRDDDPLAVPAVGLRGAARRRAGDHALVGDPGLPGPRHRAACGHAGGARDAAPEHPRQRQPPVDRRSGRSPTSSTRSSAPAQTRLHRRDRRAPRTRSTRRGRSAWPSRATRRSAARPATRPLDVLGINDYFGWYPGPRARSPTSACSPTTSPRSAPATRKQAIMVTEFGAEANRDGPIDERGTYEFQSQFVTSQLARVRRHAVAQRGDLLGAAGLPRAPRLDRRQPLPDAAGLPQGPARLQRRSRSRRWTVVQQARSRVDRRRSG